MAVERRDRGAVLRGRLARIGWRRIERDLDERGAALAGPLLRPAECRALIALYGDDARFRKRVDMAPLRFGVGDYAYFADPLPPLVAALRSEIYRRLVPAANRWMEHLGRDRRFPPTLAAFRREAARLGQEKPTPLLLRYGPEGFNCLHRDLYGEIFFPFQVTIFLSRPEVDYAGGEFLLVENWPRAQSRGQAIVPKQGEMLVFPVRERPVAGRRGSFRVEVRHGVSRLHRGSRFALGIIFHDAR